jgi:hypothetical protein
MWLKVWVIGGLVFAILLSICPSVSVGLGQGSATIGRWRIYTRLVMLTIPLFIFTTFLWPVIEAKFKAIFGLP